MSVVSALGIVGWSTTGSSKEQTRRLNIFKQFINENDSRLKPGYYPDDADFKPEDYKRLFKEMFDVKYVTSDDAGSNVATG